MLPQRLDMLLAFKGIALSEALTTTEKRVAVAIIDSFNRQTGQCDPSFNRIAHLLGISRRTVIRLVLRLETHGLLVKARHGGNSHRNSYQPNWAAFRALEAHWSAIKATRHWDIHGTKMSPLLVAKPCHLAGDSGVTQTFHTNSSRLTLDAAALSVPAPSDGADRKILGHPRKGNSATAQFPNTKSLPAFSAARASAHLAAEKQWTAQLRARLAGDPERCAQALHAVDPELRSQATEAELQQPGDGIECVCAEFARRGLVLWQF